jgi:riboflavin biosynthesis pyrimidine reductase
MVYTDFVASLDGRIAIKDPGAGGYQVPKTIANPRDWRLFQELAAQADILITSGRYVRDVARGQAQSTLDIDGEDLKAWRLTQGLSAQPAIAVVSASLDLPLQALPQDAELYVITGERADAIRVRQLKQTGAKILWAGEGTTVDGRRMIEVLAELGFKSIYSTTGPKVMHTLLSAGVLGRLYLTFGHRVLGGEEFATLFTGPLLQPPVNFELISLYYDPPALQGAGQCFAAFELG